MSATDDVAKVIPFFYYDLVARMVPGGLTLATFLLVRDKLPYSLLHIFQSEQTWNAVVIPLALGGLSYMIGTAYEVFNDCYLFKWLRESWDDKAFRDGFISFISQVSETTKDKVHFPFTKEKGERLRKQEWERMVFEAAKDSQTNTLFTHCHRFQAEYKMFLHLMYPAMLLALMLAWQHSYRWAIVAILAVWIFRYLARRRDERRWLQLLVFGRKLEWEEILKLIKKHEDSIR